MSEWNSGKVLMVGGLWKRGTEVAGRTNARRHFGVRAALVAACALFVLAAAVAAQSVEKPKRSLFSIFGRAKQPPAANSERSSKNHFMQMARQTLAEARWLAKQGELEKAIESARRAKKLATISTRFTPAKWNRDEQSPSEYLRELEAKHFELHGHLPQTKIQLANSEATHIDRGTSRIQHADADLKLPPDNVAGNAARHPAIWQIDDIEDTTNAVANRLAALDNVLASQDDVGRRPNKFDLDSPNTDSRRANSTDVATISEDPLNDDFDWQAKPASKQQTDGFRLDLTDRKTPLGEFVPVETPIRTAMLETNEFSSLVPSQPATLSADRPRIEFNSSAPGNSQNAAAEIPSNAIRTSESTRGESPLLPESFEWQRDAATSASAQVGANADSNAVSIPKASKPVPWPEQMDFGNQAVAAVNHSDSSNKPSLWTSAIVHLASTLAALFLVVLLFVVIRACFLYWYGTDLALVFRIERVPAHAPGNAGAGLQKSEYRAGNNDSAANPFGSSDSPFPLGVIASEYDDRRREEEQQQREQEQAMLKQVFEQNLKLREQIAELDNDDSEVAGE